MQGSRAIPGAPAWSGSMIFSRLCQNNDQRSGWFQSPGFQDSRVPGSRFQYPRFQGAGLQGSTGVPEVRSFKVPGFQGNRGSRSAKFQSSRVPGFQDQFSRFKVPRFQGSRVPGPGCFHGSRLPRVPRFQKFQGSKAPEVSKVQKFQSSRVPGLGFQGFRVAGFQGSSIPRFQGFRVPGFQGSRVPGSHGFRVPRFPGFQASQVFQGFMVPGSQQGSRCAGLQGSKVPGFQGCRVPESLRVPGFRFQGFRVPGFQDSRVPGFQGSRVPFRILKAASPREPAPALEIETQQALLLGIIDPSFHVGLILQIFRHEFGITSKNNTQLNCQ